MRTIRLSALTVLAIGTAAAIWLLIPGEADRLRKEKEQLALEKAELQRAIERLTGEQRVAEIHVVDGLPAETDEPVVDRGKPAGPGQRKKPVPPRGASLPAVQTTIEFIELDRQQHPLPGKRFTVRGDVVFFDALVIKFDQELVAAGDPVRGKSLTLFRRVYGEYQNPADGFAIDPAGDVPNVFRVNPDANRSELQLWERFWYYAGHPADARAEGVRVIQGEAVYVPMRQGQVWTLTLQNNGGLNLRLHRAASSPAMTG